MLLIYRLIADAVIRAQAQHLAGEDIQRAELATVEAQLTKTKQLRTRRDGLTDQLTDVPQPLPQEALAEVAEHIAEIIASGTDNQRKALIETLIAEIKITAANRIIPIFRIPQPQAEESTLNAAEAPTGAKPPGQQGLQGRSSCSDQFGGADRARTRDSHTASRTGGCRLRVGGKIVHVAVRDTSLLGLLVEGLTAAVTKAEREQARTPPYPVPAAQRPSRERLVRELVSRLPSEGDGPLTVTRVMGRPISYRSEVDSLRRPGGFDFGDAACALLAVGALDDTDVEELVEFLPAYCGVRRQQVLNRLAVGDLAQARAAADRIAEGLSWIGYRDIGALLADRGDTEGFFTDWKRYAAGRERHGMAELKRRLVIGVAGKQGWQAALAVARDKRVGPGFAKFAFHPFLIGDVEGLLRLFAGDAAGVLAETDELSLLAQAVRAASDHNPERDHPLLDGIVDRIIAVDPTTDKAIMRWRDAELYALWPAYGEQATLDRVRSAVRTPRYRRDLTVLARNIGRSKNAR